MKSKVSLINGLMVKQMKGVENQYIEFKESWRDEYLKWICGFANAQGGTLIIGVDDKKTPVGIDNAAKLLEDLPNKIRDLLGIIVEVNLVKMDGKKILEIQIPSYSNPISYRSHYYQRSGSTLQELKGASLDRFLLRNSGRTWDSIPVPGVNIDDLSAFSIKVFRELASRSGRLDEADLIMSDKGLLEKLKLTEGSYLKRSAILLFHEDPRSFVTGAHIKIGYFKSETELLYQDEIAGDLFSQSYKTIDLLRTKYMKAAITYEGIQRIESYPVPYSALREAVLNAVVHRDYAVPAPIQIRVYPNKLKIWNPVILPENWTLKKLLGDHSSHPYNPEIANCFFRAGEIESWGRGIHKMFLACKEAGMTEPVLRLSENDLWLEFLFSEKYLENIGEKSDKLGNKLGNRLGNKRERILEEMIKNPFVSGKQLAEMLGISITAVEKHIKYLRENGMIKRAGGTRGHWEVLENK